MNDAQTLIDLRAIANHIRAIDPDDDQLLADMIEAETDTPELLDLLLEREATCRTHIEANKARVALIKERNARLQTSADVARSAMLKILNAAGLRSIERPEATVSISRTPAKLIEGDISDLPTEMVKVIREPDRNGIKRALKDGRHLTGWKLSNGGETVTVRRK